MKRLLYLCFIAFFFGCKDPSSNITKDGITRDIPITEGFYLSEITVSDFDETGMPLQFHEEETASVFCGPTNSFAGYLGKTAYNSVDKSLVLFHQKRMDTIMKLNNNRLGGAPNNKRSSEWVDSQKAIDSIRDKYFPFQPQQKIDFYSKDKNYKWIYTTKGLNNMKFYDYSKKLFDTLPFKLKTDQWYLLNFSNAHNTIDEVFFKIHEDGNVKQFAYYKVVGGV